jgi:hypothetical protein
LSVGIGLRLRPAFDVVIPGLYAWAVTVMVPIQKKDAEGWPVFFTWFSVICLGVASALVATRLRRWSAIAVALFVSCSASVWFLTAPLEVSFGFLGSIGWASFAIGWVRAAETVGDERTEGAHRVDLLPRHRASAITWMRPGIGLGFSLGVLGLAWTIEGRERALLGQTVAAVAALSVMSAASAASSTVGRQAVAQVFSRKQLGRGLLLAGLFAAGIWMTFFLRP